MALNPRNVGAEQLADELDEIGKRCAALPVLDARVTDEILGYDEHGLPHRLPLRPAAQ